MSDLINETKVPSIPSLDNIQDVNVRNVLAAMKELLEVREGLRPKGDDLDVNVTFRDLYNAGFAGVNVGGQIVTNTQADNQLVQPIAGSGGDTIINNTTVIEGGTTPDLTIPSAPSGLVATGTVMNVVVEWAHISDANHSHIEVWRSASNNLGVGVKVGTSDGDIYMDALGVSNATRYYWIRAVSKAGIAGGYNAGASSGTAATTGMVGSGDLISVDGAKIVDATIVDAKIYSLAATKILSGRIAATESVEVGTGANKVIIDGLGNVRMGATGYATGSGFWIGENAGLSKFYLGTSTEYVKYNGSNLEINTTEFKLTAGGNAEFSGNLDAPSGTLGQVTIGASGWIKGGQTDYNTGSGFFLGYDATAPANYKFSIGNPAGQYITWDGVEMLSNGLAKLGGIKIYTFAGEFTFTVPANVSTIYVAEIIGGGGGGGGCNTYQYAGAAGDAGGTSSVGAYITAAGGGGGQGSFAEVFDDELGNALYVGRGGAGGSVGPLVSEAGSDGFYGGPVPDGNGSYYYPLNIPYGGSVIGAKATPVVNDIYGGAEGVNAAWYGCGGSGSYSGSYNLAASGSGGAGGYATWTPIIGLISGSSITITVGEGGVGGVNRKSGGSGKNGKVTIIW